MPMSDSGGLLTFSSARIKTLKYQLTTYSLSRAKSSSLIGFFKRTPLVLEVDWVRMGPEF